LLNLRLDEEGDIDYDLSKLLIAGAFGSRQTAGDMLAHRGLSQFSRPG